MGGRKNGERMVVNHGEYLVAIDKLAFSFSLFSYDTQGESFDTDDIINDLWLAVAHIAGQPNCRYCDPVNGLLPSESTCIEALDRLFSSVNRGMFSGISVEVYVADGKDMTVIEDPVDYLFNHLQKKRSRINGTPIKVIARTAVDDRPN